MMPIPYTLKSDSAIAVLLLCCFFLTSLLLSRNRGFVWQLAKDFVMHRERSSISDTPSVGDMRFLLLSIGQTCILAGIVLFVCFHRLQPDLPLHIPSLLLVGIYVGVCAATLALKWVIYSFLGWIFFDKGKVLLWFSSYSTLLYYAGFALFPVALCMVYFDIPTKWVVIISLLVVVFSKLLILYKWVKLFCGNLCGCFLLIVYFCALEIIPCFVLFRGMVLLNDCCIIKI